LTAGAKVSIEIHLHRKWEEMSVEAPPVVVTYNFDHLILDESDDLLVLNKPSGLDVQGGSHVHENIDAWLKSKSSEYRLVHRIDRVTSGLLIVAKSLVAAISLTQMFRTRSVKKCYRAIVVGAMPQNAGEINLPIVPHTTRPSLVAIADGRGKPAVTKYRVVSYDSVRNFSELELVPLTGRKHQLRLHLAALGHPICGDNKYGQAGAYLHWLPPNVLLLHAWKISLVDPPRSWTAPLPDYWPDNMRVKG
jgi:23S rRNA pseudouridine955/2504/2580 synthase